ncbi:hypothetical protein [Chroococcidiopsis sp. SAG 2025]|nr:hypothetical protein [Chroococcidiopsis sp. SAG 2025]
MRPYRSCVYPIESTIGVGDRATIARQELFCVRARRSSTLLGKARREA